MTRIFLTGGTGFIATHVLDLLLEEGHSVVTSVRSEEKAAAIKKAHPNLSKDKLDFAIVKDIAVEGAFDAAVVSDPPFEVVIHTASPFHFNITDVKKDLLDPATLGTTGVLKAIKKGAPSVKRVVITSSFAAIINRGKGLRPGHVYSEKDWNPITFEEAIQNPSSGYSASKALAERAAWDFVEKESPSFQLTTCNPPLVFGPVAHSLPSLATLNTSNERIRDIVLGKYKDSLPPTGTFLWTDVRDVALAHVRAATRPEAAGKRFFITAGHFSNRQIADIIAEEFPDLREKIAGDEVKSDFDPEGTYKYDNSQARNILGIHFRTLKESVVDTVKSLQAVAAHTQ